MDSQSNFASPASNFAVVNIKRFLSTLGVLKDNFLAPVTVKVIFIL